MTTKQRLHHLIEQLPETETDEAARLLEELAARGREALKLPAAAELAGTMPDLTGEMTTAEYLRSVRGG